MTLTGPGGVGKTRLALAVAAAFAQIAPGRVCFIPLASLHDPALVLPAIARALEVTPPGDRPLRDHLISVLAEHDLLLVLDNCEHLLAAAAEFGGLLAGVPGLKILATSRALLRLYGEHEVQVAPLPVPAMHALAASELARSAVVQLWLLSGPR